MQVMPVYQIDSHGFRHALPRSGQGFRQAGGADIGCLHTPTLDDINLVLNICNTKLSLPYLEYPVIEFPSQLEHHPHQTVHRLTIITLKSCSLSLRISAISRLSKSHDIRPGRRTHGSILRINTAPVRSASEAIPSGQNLSFLDKFGLSLIHSVNTISVSNPSKFSTVVAGSTPPASPQSHRQSTS